MTTSFALVLRGVVSVTDETGKTGLVAGVPSSRAASPVTALLAGLVTDADSFNAPAVKPDQFLLPAAVHPDADTFYAPGIANTSQFLQPPAVADADTISAATLSASIPEHVLQPDLVAADDIIVTASISGRNELQPALLVDPDDIAIVDAGWRLLGQLLVDVDLVLSPHVETLTFLLPNIFEDGDTIDTYPFFIQAVTGGIPVPPPSGVLTGSISYPRRMTGTLDRRPRLTGSITRSTRVLTGSLKR